MTTDFDIANRLEQSARLLRAWHWMSLVSDRPADAIAVLTDEARQLIRLGPLYPGKSRVIGRLIVAYQKLITRLRHREAMLTRRSAANGPQSARMSAPCQINV